MGADLSARPGDAASFATDLSASIRGSLRPDRALVEAAWNKVDEEKTGALDRGAVLQVLHNIIDQQLKTAREDGAKTKQDIAKQQAALERRCREERSKVVGAPLEGVTPEALDRALALRMGSSAGPVMAGMLIGYMEIPVTCLTVMKDDVELLDARVALLFHTAGSKDGTLALEDFVKGYMAFFDSAPRVIGEGAPDGSKAECSLQ